MFVSHLNGFQSFGLVLDSVSNDANATVGGAAGSPAIGTDGSVYTIVRKNDRVFLRAYPL